MDSAEIASLGIDNDVLKAKNNDTQTKESQEEPSNIDSSKNNDTQTKMSKEEPSNIDSSKSNDTQTKMSKKEPSDIDSTEPDISTDNHTPKDISIDKDASTEEENSIKEDESIELDGDTSIEKDVFTDSVKSSQNKNKLKQEYKVFHIKNFPIEWSFLKRKQFLMQKLEMVDTRGLYVQRIPDWKGEQTGDCVVKVYTKELCQNFFRKLQGATAEDRPLTVSLHVGHSKFKKAVKQQKFYGPTKRKHDEVWEDHPKQEQYGLLHKLKTFSSIEEENSIKEEENSIKEDESIESDGDTSIEKDVFTDSVKSSQHKNKPKKEFNVLYIKNFPIEWSFFKRKQFLMQKLEIVDSRCLYVTCILNRKGQPTGNCVVKVYNQDLCQTFCRKLQGVTVQGRLLSVRLDVGLSQFKKTVRQEKHFVPTKRKHDEVFPEQPNHWEDHPKKEKIELPFVKPTFLPIQLTSPDNYGLSLSLLSSLGITPPLSRSIFVCNLHEGITAEKLKEVFSMAGDVQFVRLYYFRSEPEKFKGKANIMFDHPIEAVQAIAMFDQKPLYDRVMEISMDRSKVKQIPVGLTVVGNGLGEDGTPIRGVRLTVELQQLKKSFTELERFVKEKLSQPQQPTTNNSANLPSNNFSFNPPSNSQNMFPNSTNQSPQSDVMVEMNAIMNQLQGLTQQVDASEVSKTLKSLQNQIAVLQNRPNQTSGNQNNPPMTQQTQNSQYVSAMSRMISGVAQMPHNIPAQMPHNIPPPMPYSSPGMGPAFFPMGQQIPRPFMFQPPPNYLPNTATTVPNFIQNLVQSDWNTSAPLQAAHNPVSKQSVSDATQNNQQDKQQDKVPARPSRFDMKEYSYNASKVRQKEDKKLDSSDMLVFTNLPSSVTVDALNKKMREVGELMFGEVTGQGRAIVRFKNAEDSERCIKLFNRSKVDGQTIEVKFL